MKVVLNEAAFEHAKRLIRRGRYVADDRDAWTAHRPPIEVENAFLVELGWEKYAIWCLGVDREEHHDVKQKYLFLYGDFEDVHQCALLSAESQARLYGHDEVARGARELAAMIDERIGARPQPSR